MDSDPDAHEGWESDSVKTVEDCTDDDSDLDQEAALSLVPFPQNVVRFEPPPRIEVVKNASSVVDADTDPVSPMRAPLPDVQVRAVRTPITQLVQHLRKDNERLQQLLVDAQCEAEEASQRGQDKGNVDYAHLLELAKEFSTSIGDDAGPENEMSDTQGFRMNADDTDEKDLKIKKLKAEIIDVKDKLSMRQSCVKSHQQKQNRKKKDSEELVGCWVSSKTSELHLLHLNACPEYASTATRWQITEIKKESLTLQNSNGMEHTVERLKTKMFGESLLWGSGDLWTKKLEDR